jgi:hypothetical protein
MDRPLNFRQIHLDFHTSEHIPGIGADFDPDEFAATLDAARVNSVTVFARCHHGYLYFDSKQHPERIHPHLARPNLLAEQIEACHKRGIRAPIYITVQWDQFTADRHRDWLCIDAEGREYNTRPLNAGFYRFMDVFHPGYRQFLFDHVREVLTTVPTDGIFFDIVQPQPSLAKHWLDAMAEAGVNPEDARARQRYAGKVIQDWQDEMTAFVREYSKDCTIFYNSGHVGPRHRAYGDAFTHYELESLPSGGWGYLHFPQAMRYARRLLGKECLGMTGKFHTSWGDFGSYKNEAALQFECFHMLALGAKCSIGDQLPPRGRLDAETYRLIGGVYAEVERKEPYCAGAVPVAEVGVLTPEEFVERRPAFDAKSERDTPAILGAVRMLQELRVQYDIIDSEQDFAAYKVLVLPDDVPVEPALGAKLKAFVEGGGSLLASNRSGLALDGGEFAPEFAELFGVEFREPAHFSPDFLRPGPELLAAGAASGKDAAHVMYQRGTAVSVGEGAEVLATVEASYFNRTWQHFCSHAHTPPAGRDAGYPGVTRKGRCVYFAHPVFGQYFANAPRWCKTTVGAALSGLLPAPLVTVDGPTGIIAALNRQEAEGRYVLHLLYYVPERRGTAFDVIEDVLPVYNVKVRLNLPGPVNVVTLAPDGGDLPFERDGDAVTVTVPELVGHAMLVVR